LKVLLVAARYPWPPRRGDQMRAVQALAALAAEHEVTLLAPRPDENAPRLPAGAPFRVETYDAGGASALPLGLARAAARGWPLQTALFVSSDLSRKIRSLSSRAELGILQLARLAPYAADFGELPLVVDLIDSLALNFERRAAVDRPWMRPLWLREAARLERAERGLVARSLRSLLVCERDRADQARRVGARFASRLGVVGIEVEADEPSRFASAASGPPVLALTGNLGYFVNADAARWFLRRVWPELHRRRPDLRLRLAGDRPTRAVRRAARAPGVELHASPGDLKALLRGATLSLAPMRCGSGVPIKILEAWALGVPVVASIWAAAGTPARPGEDLALAGDEPDAWIEIILRLLNDPDERAHLVRGGRQRLAEHFSREVIDRAWRQAVAVEGAPASRNVRQ